MRIEKTLLIGEPIHWKLALLFGEYVADTVRHILAHKTITPFPTEWGRGQGDGVSNRRNLNKQKRYNQDLS